MVLFVHAGSGKTTFLRRLVSHTESTSRRGYVMNLDPAVMTLPFGANIDIRDTVRYKEVMKEFNLGPNGGILTSLNLFATKFDEVYHHTQHTTYVYSFKKFELNYGYASSTSV